MGLLSGIFGSSKNSSSSSQNWTDSSNNAGGDLNTGTIKSGLVTEGTGNVVGAGDGITLGSGASFTLNNDLSADIAKHAISSAEASALLMKEVATANLEASERYVQSNATMAAQSMDNARAIAEQNIRADSNSSLAPLIGLVVVGAIIIYATRK